MSEAATQSSAGKKYRFSWRDGNRFSLLADGPAFFPAMLVAIEQAREYVWLEMYLVESGTVLSRFIDAMVAARRRGVEIRVLFDDYGARGLSSADRERLASVGVALVFYNPLRGMKLVGNIFRDHRKLLLVDGEVAFVGGTGLSDEFDPSEAATRWRETMVEIRGPVVSDWATLFLDVWAHQSRIPVPTRPVPTQPAGPCRARVTYTRGLLAQEIKHSLLARLSNARYQAWVVTAYFFPPWRLRRLLRRAARRGVDVRLLLPGPVTDHPAARHAGRHLYRRLLESGVRIFEYQPRFLHQKLVLCDDWVSIGSANLDRWNLRWNLEANQEIADSDFAHATRIMLERDLQDAEEIHLDIWQRRAWILRLLEYLWALVAMWAERFGRRKDVY